MGTHELNDRIRYLCAQAIMAQDDDIQPILTELRESIHQHAEMARTMTVHALGHAPTDDSPPSKAA